MLLGGRAGEKAKGIKKRNMTRRNKSLRRQGTRPTGPHRAPGTIDQRGAAEPRSGTCSPRQPGDPLSPETGWHGGSSLPPCHGRSPGVPWHRRAARCPNQRQFRPRRGSKSEFASRLAAAERGQGKPGSRGGAVALAAGHGVGAAAPQLVDRPGEHGDLPPRGRGTAVRVRTRGRGMERWSQLGDAGARGAGVLACGAAGRASPAPAPPNPPRAGGCRSPPHPPPMQCRRLRWARPPPRGQGPSALRRTEPGGW